MSDYRPVPVIGWDATRDEWLARRTVGISASDVGAVLGFSEYATPWEVWADKTGLRPSQVSADKEAIQLGHDLEEWLLNKAAERTGQPVRRTSHQLYAHPHHPWRMASPDGEAGPVDNPFGIEAKTAGLASGWGVPTGWTDSRAPLGYEFQCRWQMHVLGWSKVVLIGLIAGVGVRHYTYTRDLAIEADMVAQVEEWYRRHLVEGVEPPVGPRDSALMDDLYPTCEGGSVALDDDPDIAELLYAYAEGLSRQTAGKAQKDTAGAAIKRKLGDRAVGTVRNKPVVTWNAKKADVRWRDLLTDMYALCGWDEDDLDAVIERYRPAPTRSISVKGLPA